MRSFVLCVLVLCSAASALTAGYTHHDGELIPTSTSVVIAGTEFNPSNADAVTFGEDLKSAPESLQKALQNSASSAPQAQQQQQQQGSENPYVVKSRPWDAEMLNKRAIMRASAGVSDLLKAVDTKIPEYIHKALRDYPDDDGVQHQAPAAPKVSAPAPADSDTADDGMLEEDASAFVEVQATRLTPIQRLRAATYQKQRQNAIQASIELELESDTSAKGIEKELDNELRSLQSDPQLREWEEEAKWKQQRTDVHDALSISDSLLSQLKGHYKEEEQ